MPFRRRSTLVLPLALALVACAGASPSVAPASMSPAATVPSATVAASTAVTRSSPPGSTDASPSLAAGSQVEGTITDASGAAVPGVQVQASSGGTSSCCAELLDSGRRYRFALAPGRYELGFSAPGFLRMARDVTTVADGSVVVDVVMQRGEEPSPSVATLAVVAGAQPTAPRTVDDVVGKRLEGRHTVTGQLVGRLGGEVELCAAVLESFPPQCGRPALVVTGLDVASVPGIQQANGVVWSERPVTVTGDVTQP